MSHIINNFFSLSFNFMIFSYLRGPSFIIIVTAHTYSRLGTTQRCLHSRKKNESPTIREYNDGFSGCCSHNNIQSHIISIRQGHHILFHSWNAVTNRLTGRVKSYFEWQFGKHVTIYCHFSALSDNRKQTSRPNIILKREKQNVITRNNRTDWLKMLIYFFFSSSSFFSLYSVRKIGDAEYFFLFVWMRKNANK